MLIARVVALFGPEAILPTMQAPQPTMCVSAITVSRDSISKLGAQSWCPIAKHARRPFVRRQP